MANDPVAEIRERVVRLEACILPLQTDIGIIKAELSGLKENYNLAKLMIQWIVFPLVTILGAIVGVKVIFPTV